MANLKYLDFLGNVWKYLSLEDKYRLGELWHGYEQIMGSPYQLLLENIANVAIQDMLPYQMKRWLNYNFLPENVVLRKPIFTSTQDLSKGIRTDTRYLLHFLIADTIDVEVNIRGDNASLASIDDIIRNINLACGFTFAYGIFDNTVIQLVYPGTNLSAGIKILPTSDPSKNASEFVLGITDVPYEVPYYPYSFVLPYPKIADIPEMQTRIRLETPDVTYLEKNTDYILEPNDIISFKVMPPSSLWAERTFIDEETPWHNFGFLMGIYDKNTPGYLSILQGLWYAFWTGPRPESIKTALYLLFGLPVAMEDTVVTSVTETEIVTTSFIGITRTFQIPIDLVAIVTVGQELKKFQPLVSGIDVYDKVNLPGFITTEIGRAGIQSFLTENASRGTGDTDETKAMTLLEEHTFLPQISVNAFVSPKINLANVKLFLSQIKPLHKTFLSQVIVGLFRDRLNLNDKIGLHIGIDITPNLDSNQTTFLDQDSLDDYETVDNEGLNLDTDVALMQESVEIDVYSFGVLIDSFSA